MAVKRLKIGIIFNFNASWMGGIIYILNLIKILDFLDDDKKPDIILFYRPDLKKFADKIDYSYLTVVQWDFPNVFKGYIKSWLTGRNIFVHKIINQYGLDGLYPLHDYPLRVKSKTKLISWYADLQHEYYPAFFSKRKSVGYWF